MISFSGTCKLTTALLRTSVLAEANSAKQAKLPVKKPESYVLSLEDLIENNYPLPSYLVSEPTPLEDGWFETPKLEKKTLTPPPKTMIAMDCEMVWLSSKQCIDFQNECRDISLTRLFGFFFAANSVGQKLDQN